MSGRREIDHGSPQGARAHYRRGEKPCEECAKADNRRRRKEAEDRKQGDDSGPRAERELLRRRAEARAEILRYIRGEAA